MVNLNHFIDRLGKDRGFVRKLTTCAELHRQLALDYIALETLESLGVTKVTLEELEDLVRERKDNTFLEDHGISQRQYGIAYVAVLEKRMKLDPVAKGFFENDAKRLREKYYIQEILSTLSTRL